MTRRCTFNAPHNHFAPRLPIALLCPPAKSAVIQNTAPSLAALALVALSSCVSPPTLITVEFETDVPAERVTAVRAIMVRGSQPIEALSGRRVELQTSAGQSALRGSFSIVPTRGDPRNGAVTGAVEVSVLSVAGAQPVTIRRWFRAAFIPSRPQVLRMFIPLACAARAVGCARTSAESCTLSDRCEDFGLTCSDDATCTTPDLVPVTSGDSSVLTPTSDVADAAPRPDIVLVDSGVAPPDAAAMDVADASAEAGDSGCSANLSSDPLNCGACGRACPSGPNSTAACVMGACSLVCAANFGDCDRLASNGCELRIDTPSACGSCTTMCSGSTPLCSGGRCASGCAMGETLCNGMCVNTNTNPSHCGGCMRGCASAPDTNPTCTAGMCGITCNSGYGNCNGSTADGCEVNTTNDPNNCSACGTVCPTRANASRVCSMSICRFACNMGFGDCNGTAADGCEQPLNVMGNCGACGASPSESCDGRDNNCNGISDEGFRAQWMSMIPARELRALNAMCMPGSEGSIACRNAANDYCATHASTCATNGIGPSFAMPGIVNVLCVQGSARLVIPFSDLTAADRNCIPDMPNVAACTRAIHLYFQGRGFVTGTGVRSTAADVTAVCFDTSRVNAAAMRYSMLRTFDPDCDGVRERAGVHCNQAINAQCQMLGMGVGGFGPTSNSGDNLDAWCVLP
jgi:hypothetical protein